MITSKDETKKSENGTKRIFVNSGANVISMLVVPVKMRYGNSENVVETYALIDNCNQCPFSWKNLLRI